MKKVLAFIIIFTFLPIFAFAAGYQPLSPIPGLSGGGTAAGAGDGDIAGYLKNLYSFGVAAAAGLAVIMVILGGIQYITSVSGEGKGGGKDRITSAILGLLLALGSYIILNTINKDLLKLSFEFDPGPAFKTAPTVAPEYGTQNPASLPPLYGTQNPIGGQPIQGNANMMLQGTGQGQPNQF